MRLTVAESRELLELPADGEVDEAAVKSKFKKLALIWWASTAFGGLDQPIQVHRPHAVNTRPHPLLVQAPRQEQWKRRGKRKVRVIMQRPKQCRMLSSSWFDEM